MQRLLAPRSMVLSERAHSRDQGSEAVNQLFYLENHSLQRFDQGFVFDKIRFCELHPTPEQVGIHAGIGGILKEHFSHFHRWSNCEKSMDGFNLSEGGMGIHQLFELDSA